MAKTIPTRGPAGRIYDLARRMREIPDNTTMEEAWHQLLGLPEGASSAEWEFAFTRVIGMVLEAQSGFHQQSLESQFTDPYPAVIKLFAQSPRGGEWRNLKAQFAEQLMSNLALAATLLADDQATPELERVTLDEIREKAQELRDDTGEASCDPELQQVIVEHLDGILRAVDLYAVCGPEGIRTAFLQSWGVLVVHVREVVKAGADEATQHNESIVRKFINFLTDYSKIVRAARDSAVLAAAGKYLVEHVAP